MIFENKWKLKVFFTEHNCVIFNALFYEMESMLLSSRNYQQKLMAW